MRQSLKEQAGNAIDLNPSKNAQDQHVSESVARGVVEKIDSDAFQPGQLTWKNVLHAIALGLLKANESLQNFCGGKVARMQVEGNGVNISIEGGFRTIQGMYRAAVGVTIKVDEENNWVVEAYVKHDQNHRLQSSTWYKNGVFASFGMDTERCVAWYGSGTTQPRSNAVQTKRPALKPKTGGDAHETSIQVGEAEVAGGQGSDEADSWQDSDRSESPILVQKRKTPKQASKAQKPQDSGDDYDMGMPDDQSASPAPRSEEEGCVSPAHLLPQNFLEWFNSSAGQTCLQQASPQVVKQCFRYLRTKSYDELQIVPGMHELHRRILEARMRQGEFEALSNAERWHLLIAMVQQLGDDDDVQQ
jgi:hypothetical protein